MVSHQVFLIAMENTKTIFLLQNLIFLTVVPWYFHDFFVCTENFFIPNLKMKTSKIVHISENFVEHFPTIFCVYLLYGYSNQTFKYNINCYPRMFKLSFKLIVFNCVSIKFAIFIGYNLVICWTVCLSAPQWC